MQKKKIIVISLITVILMFISILAINYSQKASYTKEINGIRYAMKLDGNSISSVPSKGLYRVDVECENAKCYWDYDAWELKIRDVKGEVKCDIDFVTITKNNLNDYVISLAGTTQGTGQVVSETTSIDNSTFTDASTITQSGYNVLTNEMSNSDTDSIFTFDSSANTWTSNNHTHSATATMTFNVTTAGHYQVCYTQSSEQNYDYTTFYKNNTSILSLKGVSTTSYKCTYLGEFSTSDTIKVIYQKDSSGSSGSDSVVFYLQGGTYNENIQKLNAGTRYEGKNPNNYIWFNNELWRIIGVFDSDSHGQNGTNLVKIMRVDSIGSLVWDKSNTNNWESSSLNSLLNGAYYNAKDGTDSGYCYTWYYNSSRIQANCDYRTNGIQDGYRNMIQNVTWYLGGYSDNDATAEAFYGYERGTTVYSERPTSTTGYIGLMYPSDYGYSVLSSCCARKKTLYSSEFSICEGWIKVYKNAWMLSHYSINSQKVFMIGDFTGLYWADANYGYATHPVLYLKSDVYYIDGDGSILDPIIIGE